MAPNSSSRSNLDKQPSRDIRLTTTHGRNNKKKKQQQQQFISLNNLEGDEDPFVSKMPTRFDALVSHQTKASNELKQLLNTCKEHRDGGYKNFGVLEKIEEMTKTLQEKEQTMHSDSNIATRVSMSRYDWRSMSPLDDMNMVPDNNIATRVSTPENRWRRSRSPLNYEKMYSDYNTATWVSTPESSWRRWPSPLNYEKMDSDNNIATGPVSMQLIT